VGVLRIAQEATRAARILVDALALVDPLALLALLASLAFFT
jgi:hypothetical protein